MESSLRATRKTGRGSEVKTQHICVAPSELQNAQGGEGAGGVVVQTSADAERKEGESKVQAPAPAVSSKKKKEKGGSTSTDEEIDVFDLDQCERCIHIIKSLGLWRD